MTVTPIYLMVALPAEAKPLIRAFGLERRQPDGACPRYTGGALNLVLSGPGMAAAAAAVTFVRALDGDRPSYWINLGIAGHSRLDPGACLLANSVTDAQTGERWPLQPLVDIPTATIGPLHCVGEPEVRYAASAGYDMESAGIARGLSDSGALARLQVMKIISDNPNHPNRGISGRMVSELIQRQLPTLEALIRRLPAHARTR